MCCGHTALSVLPRPLDRLSAMVGVPTLDRTLHQDKDRSVCPLSRLETDTRKAACQHHSPLVVQGNSAPWEGVSLVPGAAAPTS